MSEDVVVRGEVGLARRASVMLEPVMNVEEANSRLDRLQEFCSRYLQESKDGGNDGGDYGVIPGAGKKKVLLKSGADKLCDVYGLADTYVILSRVEDHETGLFDYTIECRLVSKVDDSLVGSGLGSCSSYESKYRWRDAQRVCPSCGSEAIIKGKDEFGGGWLCWAKKGGCGAKFADTDPAITGQRLGRVLNPDLADVKNTVLKIAKKRAKIDGVIGVTRSSGIYTQDLDDELQQHARTQGAGAGDVIDTQAVRTESSASTQSRAETGTQPRGQCPDTNEEGARCSKQAGHITAHEYPKVAARPAATTQAAAPARTAAPPVQAQTQEEHAALPEGVRVVSLNVRNGPMVMTDGVSKPSWGPLYIVTFSQKVKASDGKMVAEASTFDEKMALAAEDARDNQSIMVPVVEPASKKGSYNLMGLRQA